MILGAEIGMLVVGLIALFSGKFKLSKGRVVEGPAGASGTDGTDEPPPTPIGWRHAREVVSYLRGHGAKITGLERDIDVEWIALNSDGDLSSPEERDPASPRS